MRGEQLIPKSSLIELLDPLPIAIWSTVGAIAMHLWRRYRSRTVTLRWQAHHQPIAFSAQDVLFGTIEVRYNSQEVQNLFFTTVDLQNLSTTDLRDLDLNLFFRDASVIFMAHGEVLGSANLLPFAEPFKSELDRLLKMQPGDPNAQQLASALQKRRDFRVPVLNRDSSVRIAMVVQALPGRRPFLSLATDHAGVKLVFQGPQDLVFGVPRNMAALAGLVAGAAIVGTLALSAFNPAGTAFIALALGALTAANGAGIIKILRWLTQLLS